jgi:hypothetical protein
MTVEIKHVIDAAQRIIDSVNDNGRHGGLLSRDTIRACDDGRLVIDRFLNGPPQVDWSNVEGVDYSRGEEKPRD